MLCMLCVQAPGSYPFRSSSSTFDRVMKKMKKPAAAKPSQQSSSSDPESEDAAPLSKLGAPKQKLKLSAKSAAQQKQDKLIPAPGSPEPEPEGEQRVLRHHNKMMWLSAQLKKGSLPKTFVQTFEAAEKISKIKGSALVNECVVRDGRGWKLVCDNQVYKEWAPFKHIFLCLFEIPNLFVFGKICFRSKTFPA